MRIVSLLPGATELVCALGLRDQLVAVSHECDFPHGIEALPRITSSILPEHLTAAEIDRAVVNAVRSGRALYRVDGDLLERLTPDLIVTQGVCDVCAVNVGTVRESLELMSSVIAGGVETVVLQGKTFEGMLADLDNLGLVSGRAREAQAVVADCRRRWQQLGARARRGERPRVLVLEWPDPFFHAGHWVPEMVSVAGGVDVFGKIGEDSRRCTLEAIHERDPEIVVLAACGYGLSRNLELARRFEAAPEHAKLAAVRTGSVWAVDANSQFSRPTPRLVDGAQTLLGIFSTPGRKVEGARRAGPPS